jgi:hypothetical protein
MNSNKTTTSPLVKEISTNWPIYVLAITLIGYYIFCWFAGIDQVINWQIMSQLEEKTAIVDRFNIGAQNFEIPSKVFYLIEQYIPTTLQVNQLAILIWLGLFSLGFCLIAAIATRLKSFYYLGITTFLILIITSLGIDELFGQTNYLYSGLFLFCFLSISYLFVWFFKYASLVIRFCAFAVLLIVAAILIHYFDTEPKPFLLLASKSIPAALIFSVLFIFAISYDIILGVLALTSKGIGTNKLLNFSIFTLIYLINLSLTYLHNIKYINWQMLYLSPFLLLLGSVIIGYFFIDKKPSFTAIFRTKSDLQYFYLALAIITLGLIGFSFATGNDPLTETLEDTIMYTHIVMGLCFFVYVFLNFFPLFKQNYEVYLVVFKPLKYAIYYFRAAAILIIFSVLINNQYFPVMQSFAGYYNSMADHSIATEQYNLAEVYYKTALGFERQNHKSNYGMASLAAKLGQNTVAGKYYREAIQKKPTDYAFAALSNSLQTEDMFFEAMFALKDGLKKYPKSGELQNNLALLFAKSKAYDSTFFYLEKAKLIAKNKAIPEANLIGFLLKTENVEKLNAINTTEPKSNYNALNANYLAVALLNNSASITKNEYQFDGDSALSMANFAWLYNQTMTNAKSEKYTNAPYSKLIANDGNFNIANELRAADVFNEYYGGNKLKSLEALEAITINKDSSANSKYSQILFNTLLKKARETPSTVNYTTIATTKDVEKALSIDPLNENILEKSVAILNQNKAEKQAYDILLAALHWESNSARLQKLYILQCFKIHMKSYAKDGLLALKAISSTEYDQFLPIYQAQLALVENSNDGFN